jgi:hypothetical protein
MSNKMFHKICDDAYCQATRNYRNLLDKYLECIGKEWDMDLRMNHQGVCFFQYEQFVIVVEAPKGSASVFVYTCVLICTSTSTAVMKRVLEMNYLTQETCGCTLGLDRSCEDDNALEVTLSYSQPIMGLNRGELCTIVVNFMQTTSYIHCRLTSADSEVEAPTPFRPPPHHTASETSTANEEESKAPAPFQPPPRHTARKPSTPENEAVTPIMSNKSFGPKPLDRARQDQSYVRHPNPKVVITKKSSLQKTFTKMTLALGRSTSKISTKKKGPKKVVAKSSTPHHQIYEDAFCEATQNYRNLLDQYLECLGKDWGMDLRMNHHGVCFFQYDHCVIVVEAPKESASFFVYTCVLRCTSTSTAVMKRALEMNYLTQETCGCTLGLDRSCEDDNVLEVTLSYSQPIMGLNRGELCNIVINFMQTASYIHCQLASAESQVEAPCEQPKHTFRQANEEEPKAPAPFQLPPHHTSRETSTANEEEPKASILFQPPPYHTACETSTPEHEVVTPILSNKSFGPKPLDRERQDQSSVRHLNPKLAIAKKPSLQKTFTKMTLALGRSTSKISTKKKACVRPVVRI